MAQPDARGRLWYVFYHLPTSLANPRGALPAYPGAVRLGASSRADRLDCPGHHLGDAPPDHHRLSADHDFVLRPLHANLSHRPARPGHFRSAVAPAARVGHIDAGLCLRRVQWLPRPFLASTHADDRSCDYLYPWLEPLHALDDDRCD